MTINNLCSYNLILRNFIDTILRILQVILVILLLRNILLMERDLLGLRIREEIHDFNWFQHIKEIFIF
jgi:hypothetical protein